MRPSLESLELSVNGFKITGIRQSDPNVADQPRLLCVHGWLDNANSFVPLMPYLPAFDLVAIDLPGNGYSASLEGGYSIYEVSFLLHQLIHELGWSECHLMGHSLGGGFCTLLCAASPPTIKTLTLVEASGMLSEPASKLPGRISRALQDRVENEKFDSRLFKTKQEAIDARLRAAKMHVASAKLIIDRQLEKTTQGYKWRFDKRWRYASPQYLTEEQVQHILKAITCPVLSILADDGFLIGRDNTEQRLACFKHHEQILLSGHHHVHMDTPEPVAAAINRFHGTLPAMGG